LDALSAGALKEMPLPPRVGAGALTNCDDVDNVTDDDGDADGDGIAAAAECINAIRFDCGIPELAVDVNAPLDTATTFDAVAEGLNMCENGSYVGEVDVDVRPSIEPVRLRDCLVFLLNDP
jgi:hypothetical protein